MSKESFMKSPVEKLIVVLLLEVFLILLVVGILGFYRHEISVAIIVTIIAVINFVISVFIVKWLLNTDSLSREIILQKAAAVGLSEALKLNRAERHDFINHLQVIYGLVENAETRTVSEYLNNLGNSCRFNGQVLNINNPTLRALVQNKKNISESAGIEFHLNVESNIKNFAMRPTAITSVFGNIFDNAFEAVANLGTEHLRRIGFSFCETDGSYHFFIQNSGPVIDEEVVRNMFNEGFSTKGEQRGVGLSLVKKIVDEYKGKVFYGEGGFNIILPKNGDSR